ncbi:rhodanese-like domain-containing protein [Anaerobacillus alkaliphilus]|nr:rhodanese-like domain-containing protein [Anaerobacillus alkaliphilus]
MNNFIRFLFLGILMIVFLTGCNEEALTGVKQLEVSDLSYRMADSIKNNDEAFYIDVREDYEFNEAYIEGFVNYPLSSFEQTYQDLPKDKEIIVICRSGNRSMKAAAFLKEQGYENVTNIKGAMLDWKGETKSAN